MGIDINREVAIKIMKWHEWVDTDDDYYGETPMFTVNKDDRCIWFYGDEDDVQDCHDFETSISCAWLVVERMRELGYEFGIAIHNDGINWTCYFVTGYRPVFTEQNKEMYGTPVHQALADTAPLAICLAALKAVSL